jgi:hypothetical protein
MAGLDRVITLFNKFIAPVEGKKISYSQVFPLFPQFMLDPAAPQANDCHWAIH